MKQLSRLAATATALAPTAAWAHGDHDGLHGVVHLLTEPLHLGALLLVGLASIAFGKRVRSRTRARAARKIDRNACTD